MAETIGLRTLAKIQDFGRIFTERSVAWPLSRLLFNVRFSGLHSFIWQKNTS
jgi:hypothetical protein